MPVLEAKDFSLAHTLECGQVFRATQAGDWYYVTARDAASGHDRLFKVRQKGAALTYEGDADESFLKRYFALDHDVNEIYRVIGVDAHMSEALDTYRGLRIIRQDPWECLISFLCSPAKNILSIKETVRSICQQYGKPMRMDDLPFWSFPAPGTLADMDGLRQAKAGFRAEFILVANSLATQEFLDSLKTQAYPEAKKKLMGLPGVGDKVADCVLLFSLGFLHAFPVDTWIKRAMREFYFGGQKVSEDKIRDFAQIYFGQYAGYAQQYIFHWVRQAHANEPEPEENE